MTDGKSESFLDMDPDAMRRAGYRVIDRVVDHLRNMGAEPAWSMVSRTEAEAALMEPAPEQGAPLEGLLEKLENDVEAWAGRIGHPRFFAFVPSAVTFPGVLGDLLDAALYSRSYYE